MQTLTELLLDQGLRNHILTAAQMARLIEGSAQRRHSLVNQSIKAGELQRVERGLYLLPRRYSDYVCHPFALAKMISPGSYVSLDRVALPRLDSRGGVHHRHYRPRGEMQ